MPKVANYLLFLTEEGYKAIRPQNIIDHGSIICDTIDPDGPYLHITVSMPYGKNTEISVDVLIPHHFVECIFSVKKDKHPGFDIRAVMDDKGRRKAGRRRS
jgi:hypothetical protein